MPSTKSAEAIETPKALTEAEAVSAGEEAHRSHLNIMADKFASEKRVTVKIHNDRDVFVQINGYSFLIAPNVKVQVPESLVPILEDAGYL